MSPLPEGVTVHALYANVYLLHTPEGRVMVDSGSLAHTPRFARVLRDFRPDALLLTHAHVDHSGGAFLAARSGVPILTHPLECPLLTGQEHHLPYPAGAPRVGQIISRLHPKVPPSALRAVLPGEHVYGWEVLPLPGHSRGQIGLLRGGVLIAGDAVISGPNGAHLPRPAYNDDHAQAVQTLRLLTELDLRVILPGHGGPLTPQQLRERARRDG
ncbi:MBL fold metallo-hydrolase [Deinococcus hopiensis]|uniref:Glyoxylase, beta-lactamase superfamily II n=1 Tax=Deinococcus hopiensis KR-140 TaxID=695939 RepID=A0A1W1UHN6_9DEIO|nr:MBL fold metallo-hydrolase [Deinococcus hopiensis]SMB80616.1 Glyoxylase, beta-lactamase superfamily II [Deinococcus hopiensis KR-140]